MLETALSFSHKLLKEIIQPGDHVVDATMGNGFDTVFLADLVGTTGHVYAFDIQEKAIQQTKQRISEQACEKQITLFHHGHEELNHYLPLNQTIAAAIFNLGYLPKGDKNIITQPDTTLQAIASLLKKLQAKGRVILVVYYGHSGGESELNAVTDYCQSLSQTSYNVLTYQFINQKNNPPILFCIEKK